MMPIVGGGLVGALVCMSLVTLAIALVGACTDGTTPDCSGSPSPCGYAPPDNGLDGADNPDSGGG